MREIVTNLRRDIYIWSKSTLSDLGPAVKMAPKAKMAQKAKVAQKTNMTQNDKKCPKGLFTIQASKARDQL